MMCAPMKRYLSFLLLACGALFRLCPATAQPNEFSFGVIGHSFKTASDESALREAIAETDEDNLAFVVAGGIKSSKDACTDALYLQRKALFESAKNGLIVSLAASDWSECRNRHGRSAAVERLNRLRELFFVDEFSFGASRIPLMRQSATAKFRSYGENARWEIGDVMFATINLPANNNHYRTEAGRNSEFEDRTIANRDWLQRILSFATRKKMRGIVLFCDGNPLARPGFLQRFDPREKRDGFAEVRQQINTLASKFSGKVLVIHGQADANAGNSTGIDWENNLGELAVGPGWTKVTVSRALPTVFSVSPVESKNASQ